MQSGFRMTTIGALLFCGASFILTGHSNGTTAKGYSGAPDESTCGACHGLPNRPNEGLGRISISLINATGYTPGQPLRIKITLEDPHAVKWGFQLTTRREGGSSSPVGTFSDIPGQGTTTAVPGTTTAVVVNQSSSGTRTNTLKQVTWEVDWNAPLGTTGVIYFYAAGVGANGDGSEKFDFDNVYTTLYTVGQGAQVVTATRVLPQFVFGTGGGAGFVTTLSFANQRDAPATIRVNFYNAEGSPMPVNGNPSQAINLGGRSTAIIRADDTGPLTQGWALIDMPEGVTGNAVFRQRVPGRADQEAVVMLSRTDSSSERFIYDQTPGTGTSLVLLNTSNTVGIINLKARLENGTLAPTVSRTLQPRTRTSIDFRTEPALALVQGHRGLVEVDTGGATFAVLALRFDDSGAFTSIPNAEK
jgi:hypothetical protein